MNQVKPINLHSAALNCRRTVYVYTPKGYEAGEDTYPVLYLLHGMFGGETDWIYHGSAVETIERLIEQGELPPTIVVFPGDGGHSAGTFYLNWYDGSGNFEDYFLYDLVDYIDGNYRTSRQVGERAIAGLSMGGFGAFLLALRNPEVWGIAASLSGVMGDPRPESGYFNASKVGPLQGPYAEEHKLSLLTALRFTEGQAPKLHMNCGVDDELVSGNRELHEHLLSLGYPHEYVEFPGAHTWTYWTNHLEDVCRFVGNAFREVKQQA